jgi:hypothetical protein
VLHTSIVIPPLEQGDDTWFGNLRYKTKEEFRNSAKERKHRHHDQKQAGPTVPLVVLYLAGEGLKSLCRENRTGIDYWFLLCKLQLKFWRQKITEAKALQNETHIIHLRA